MRVRGQGSGHLEVTTRREAPTPLMLVVATESDNRSGFHLAVRMATDLLRSVELRYSRHCASRGVEPASPAFALGPMSDALYAELGRALGERLPPRVSDEMELQVVMFFGSRHSREEKSGGRRRNVRTTRANLAVRFLVSPFRT